MFVRSIGWDAAMTTKLERGHEYTHGALLFFGQVILVIVQHLVQVQRQLWSVLRAGERKESADFSLFVSEVSHRHWLLELSFI